MKKKGKLKVYTLEAKIWTPQTLPMTGRNAKEVRKAFAKRTGLRLQDVRARRQR